MYFALKKLFMGKKETFHCTVQHNKETGKDYIG
jgi:hypothetical protein